MSALSRMSSAGSLSGLKMSAGQFFAIGETVERYELLNGVVLMSPSASFQHNDILAEIVTELRLYARRTPGTIVVPETDVRFSNLDVYRPDIVAYRAGRFRAKPAKLVDPPDLVVEVLSDGNRSLDLMTKRDDYSRFGVREYWIVDPSTATIRCWRRKDRKLVEVRGAVVGRLLRSSSLPGFSLDLDLVREAAGLPKVRLRKR